MVYGLKNFIHDFTSLDEAEKSRVAVWDDFLIYALVLEENDAIVRDIMHAKGKMPASSFVCALRSYLSL